MPNVDHDFNLQRIVDVINSNPNILRQIDNDGLLRSVQYGIPPRSDTTKEIVSQHFPMPYAYVTTASNLQETSPQTGVSIPDNVKSVTVEYSIVIVTHSSNEQVNAEKKLYNLLTLMRGLIEANPTFLKPVSNDDPIFVRSIISNVSWEEKTKGNPVQVVTMTLLATIGALFFLEVPGITDPIPLISKPVDRNTDTVEDILDDTLILRSEAITKSKRSIFTEFETSSSILTALRNIKLGGTSNSFTIQKPSGDETVEAFIVNIESSPGFSDIETTIIQLDVINPI